jgi:hypothetical protein
MIGFPLILLGAFFLCLAYNFHRQGYYWTGSSIFHKVKKNESPTAFSIQVVMFIVVGLCFISLGLFFLVTEIF